MFGFLEKNEGIAVRHQQGSLTFQEFKRQLALFGDRLRGLGLSPGDRVALLLPNSLELLAGLYACLQMANGKVDQKEILRLLSAHGSF